MGSFGTAAGAAWLYAAMLFAAGLAVGSFLNVVICRLPFGLSLSHPPSSCPKCGARIMARDNIPVLGWLLLAGKCRRCAAPISWRYPAVELATGLLWAAEGWRLAGMAGGYWANVFTGLLELAFIAAMIVTVLVDWDHRIILDEISLGGLGVALAASALIPSLHRAASAAAFDEYHPILALWLGGWPAWSRGLAVSLIGAATGLAFSLGIYFLGNAMFRRRIAEARRHDPEVDSALGMGDVKLMACLGAFLGWEAVWFVFFAASVLGAAAGTIMKLRSGNPGGAMGWAGWRNRWASGDSVIPFGPFLAAAALVFLFFGQFILDALTAYSR